MGYYTRYELQVLPNITDDIEQALEEDDNLRYAVVDEQECKWYDHESDMQTFSRKFPDNVFKLIGAGEETGDLWIKYFKNGKMQNCPAQITYDEYDEGKLR